MVTETKQTEGTLTPRPAGAPTIEVMARLTGITIEVRDLVEKWLLITYDMPHTPAGDAARQAFLKSARMAGAHQHTESVYLMPWTPTAEALALELAKSGKVCLWTSVPTNQADAATITQNYDAALEPMLDEIGKRIDKMVEARVQEHHKQADRLAIKTETLLEAAKSAIVRRGSAQLFMLAVLLERRFDAVR